MLTRAGDEVMPLSPYTHAHTHTHTHTHTSTHTRTNTQAHTHTDSVTHGRTDAGGDAQAQMRRVPFPKHPTICIFSSGIPDYVYLQ